MLILAVSLVYQLQFVVVYTPLYNPQAKDSNKPIAENSFTLLVSNVRMDNDDKEGFHKLVHTDNTEDLEKTDAGEEAEVEGKIEEGKQESAEK